MTISENRLLHTVTFTAILLVTGSCDNSFDPTDTDHGIYSVHGYLDLLSETSYIRVRDLNTPFTLKETEFLDARVELQNLENGMITVLESNIREFEDVYLHTYYYNGIIAPDTDYLLSVERSDGTKIELLTTTPTLPDPEIIPLNEACNVPVNITIEPLNGGTIVLKFGLGPSEDDRWSFTPIVFGPDRYINNNRISITITPANIIALLAQRDAHCSTLLSDGNNLYMNVAHYSPGFYEQLTEDFEHILETTLRFGSFYSDTLPIPLDVSR